MVERSGDGEETLRGRLERAAALGDCQRVIEALRLASSVLASVAEADSLAEARSAAGDALTGIKRVLER